MTSARVAAVAAAAVALLAPAAPAVGASERALVPAATEAAGPVAHETWATEAAVPAGVEASTAEAASPPEVATEAPSPPKPGARTEAPAGTALGDAIKAPTLGFLVAQGGLWSTDVPRAAGGELRTVAGTTDAPREADQVVTVRVEVETGLGVDGSEFARQVMTTLNDPRGWGHDGSVVFERTAEAADFDVVLASPETTDELCVPLATEGEVSCAIDGRAILNAERWAQGAEPFLEAGGTVFEYRRYLVNHEVGHLLGHGHEPCPEPGATAPVMLQQTLWLHGCVPNGWPAATG